MMAKKTWCLATALALCCVSSASLAEQQNTMSDRSDNSTSPNQQSQPSNQVGVTQQKFNAAIRLDQRLRTMSHGHTHAVSYFDGPDGLIGIVGINDQTHHKFIAWGTHNGKALMIGPVFARGRNLTAGLQQAITGTAPNEMQETGQLNTNATSGAPTGNETRATDSQENATAATATQGKLTPADIKQLTQNSTGVTVGSGRKHLYVYIDAYCYYCHRAISDLSQPDNLKQVTITYLPVAAIDPESKAAGASILASSKPSSAIKKAGSTLAGLDHTAKEMNEIGANTKAIEMITPRVATPTFVYVNKDGMMVYEQGLPSKMSDLIARINTDTTDQ